MPEAAGRSGFRAEEGARAGLWPTLFHRARSDNLDRFDRSGQAFSHPAAGSYAFNFNNASAFPCVSFAISAGGNEIRFRNARPLSFDA